MTNKNSTEGGFFGPADVMDKITKVVQNNANEYFDDIVRHIPTPVDMKEYVDGEIKRSQQEKNPMSIKIIHQTLIEQYNGDYTKSKVEVSSLSDETLIKFITEEQVRAERLGVVIETLSTKSEALEKIRQRHFDNIRELTAILDKRYND